MRPIIFMTVGYITGIIWGLYLKINIAPIILIIILGIIIINKKIKKYKINIILFIIFLIISNFQINYLENKYSRLYLGVSDVEIVRYNYKWYRRTENIKINLILK